MRAGGGKQKGSAFERKICKTLSLWVTNGKRDDVFWRSAMSGGRATVRAKKGTLTAHQGGDISSVHKDGHAFTDRFYVECKHYRDLQLGSFLFKGSGVTAKFWHDACTEAARYDKTPLLILQQNTYPILAVTWQIDEWVTTAPVVASIPTNADFYFLHDLVKRKYR